MWLSKPLPLASVSSTPPSLATLCALTVCLSFVSLSHECADLWTRMTPYSSSQIPPHLLIFSRWNLFSDAISSNFYSVAIKHMHYNSLFIWCPQWILGSIRATRGKGTILLVACIFMIFQYSLNIHGVYNTWHFWLFLKRFLSIKWFGWLFSSAVLGIKPRT